MSNKHRQPLYLVVIRNVVKTITNRLAGDAVDMVMDKIKNRKKKEETEKKNF